MGSESTYSKRKAAIVTGSGTGVGAATALALREPLITANRKHFAVIPGLTLHPFQPP